MSTIEATRLTADDLLALPDEDAYELVGGQLREIRRSAEASWIGGNFVWRLATYAEARSFGWVFPGGLGIQCFPHDGERVRRPHVSIYPFSRLKKLSSDPRYTRICPMLVVEVVSPDDTAFELDERIADWVTAGVGEVWVAMPPSRTVTVYHARQSSRVYRADDVLESPHCLPGFHCRVADFFPPSGDDSEWF